MGNELIVRSSVPKVSEYGEYRSYLRDDFFYHCGYCTISESEAQGVAFQIDHYEPVSMAPLLECDYDNLIYACGECNRLKSDLSPPPVARSKGCEFFRPDRHVWHEHFEVTSCRLGYKSPVGHFSIENLDLNRQSLQRLRNLRARLHESEHTVATGLLGLRSFKIDQLPAPVRARAIQTIAAITAGSEALADDIDAVLKAAAKSPLIDDDPEAVDRRAQRAASLASAKGLFPGVWRGREKKKKKAN